MKNQSKLLLAKKFGIISDPTGTQFQKHAKDYIAVIEKNPQDLESFDRLLSSTFIERTGNQTRARLKRDPNIFRTDRVVWETLEGSRKDDGLDITSESAASILSLAVQKGSGMSPEESLELVKSICQ